ncbi:MAG: hypothetical protein GWP38_06195 [Planctomycetia bacterium]|nr:hypothetical protein [Planctomycetia bacterium]
MNKINMSIRIILTYMGALFFTTPLLGNDDPWLLFRHAEDVVAGEVVQILKEERDLLYLLTDGNTGNPYQVTDVKWWREPEGSGTEGIGVQVGTRGAWLVAPVSEEKFPIQVSTLLPRGFLRMNDFTQIDDLKLILQKRTATAAALRLLDSKDSEVRRVAIGWWKSCPVDVALKHREAIEEKFTAEPDPGCQRSYLSLYLMRDWTFVGAGISELIPYSPDGTVSWLTLQYLKKKGSPQQRARLMSSWIVSDDMAREKIAIAFRVLKMREAHPWLLKAAIESKGSFRNTCLEALASTCDEENVNTLTSLLDSDCIQTRAAILRGLARSGSTGSHKLLENQVNTLHISDPLFDTARALQKNPRRSLQRVGE